LQARLPSPGTGGQVFVKGLRLRGSFSAKLHFVSVLGLRQTARPGATEAGEWPAEKNPVWGQSFEK